MIISRKKQKKLKKNYKIIRVDALAKQWRAADQKLNGPNLQLIPSPSAQGKTQQKRTKNWRLGGRSHGFICPSFCFVGRDRMSPSDGCHLQWRRGKPFGWITSCESEKVALENEGFSKCQCSLPVYSQLYARHSLSRHAWRRADISILEAPVVV